MCGRCPRLSLIHIYAVLRSFELDLGRNVTRPTIAGVMGAYGAALHAMQLGLERSALLGPEELEGFRHTARPTTCQGCTNHCSLTINTFDAVSYTHLLKRACLPVPALSHNKESTGGRESL